MPNNDEKFPLAMIEDEVDCDDQWIRLTTEGVLWNRLKRFVVDEEMADKQWEQVKTDWNTWKQLDYGSTYQWEVGCTLIEIAQLAAKTEFTRAEFDRLYLSNCYLWEWDAFLLLKGMPRQGLTNTHRSLAVLLELPSHVGSLAQLDVELVDEGRGIIAINPQPNDNVFTQFDEEFKEAYQQVWDWAKDDAATTEAEKKKLNHVDVRFRLVRQHIDHYHNPALEYVAGNSAQAAFYLCFLHTVLAYLGKDRARLLDPSVAVTATLLPENGQRRLGPVGGLSAKMRAAYLGGRRTVIVANENLKPSPDNEYEDAEAALAEAKQHIRVESPNYAAETEIISCSTPAEAANVASGLKYAVCQFLDGIEKRFKYMKLFHSSQLIPVGKQYIPIEVTLEKDSRHEVEDLYTEYDEEEDSQQRRVPWEEAREKHRRLVVLGNPGMGKTTLLKMEAFGIAKNEREALSANEKTVEDVIIPLFFSASNFVGNATKEVPARIIEAIPLLLTEKEDIPQEVLELVVEKLGKGKCILLLDRIDEVPKGEQNNLADRLENFVKKSPCPVIATSRVVGYEGTIVRDAKEVEIAPFRQNQVEKYVKRWFNNVKEVNGLDDDSISAMSLLGELRNKPQVRGLTQNPLLLSLMCSLYQARRLTLPIQLCELYHNAVRAMFDWRNKEHNPQDEATIAFKIDLLEEMAYRFSCEHKESFSLLDIRHQIASIRGKRTEAAIRRHREGDFSNSTWLESKTSDNSTLWDIIRNRVSTSRMYVQRAYNLYSQNRKNRVR